MSPLSVKPWLADPPIAERSHVAVMPVLAGVVPGVTVTVRSVESPGGTDAGLALPMPVGAVQSCTGEAVLRGFGVPAVKSAALLSESVQPELLRSAALVFVSVGAAPLP